VITIFRFQNKESEDVQVELLDGGSLAICSAPDDQERCRWILLAPVDEGDALGLAQSLRKAASHLVKFHKTKG